MAGTLRLSNTGTGNGQSTITTAASGDTTYTLPSGGGTFVTTSSTEALTVPFASGTVSAPSVTFLGDTNTGIYSPGADTIAFTEGGSEALRIDSSGRLLVGTSSTSGIGNLQVRRNSSGSATGVIELGTSDGYASIADGNTIGILRFTEATNSGLFAQIYAEADSTVGNNDYPGRLVFSVTRDGSASPTEALRITNSGAQYAFSAGDGITASVSSAASTGGAIFEGRHSASGVATGTGCFVVRYNGNVQNTNNSYGAISDIKLKENVVDAGSQWSDIKALQVRKYNFKEGQTHTQIGLIAQEVELVSPGLVTESPDRDAEGNDLGTVTKSVNYSVLYMKAVKALQEAMERIETLEASNTDLLARVSALESA